METNSDNSFKIFRSFMFKEMLISNALINGICNIVFYILLVHKAATPYEYFISTMIANVVLGVIIINLYPIAIKSKLKKNPNITIPYEQKKHIIASLYPQNTVIIRTINTIIGFIISTVFTMGIIACLNLSKLGVITGAVMRGVDSAIFSVIAYYLSMVFIKPSNPEV